MLEILNNEPGPRFRAAFANHIALKLLSAKIARGVFMFHAKLGDDDLETRTMETTLGTVVFEVVPVLNCHKALGCDQYEMWIHNKCSCF